MFNFLENSQKYLTSKNTVFIMVTNQKVARICLQGARGYCERVAGGCEIGLMVYC